MESASIVVCELQGCVGSNPRILCAYPDPAEAEQKDKIIATCLPFGAKVGDSFKTKLGKDTACSHVFRIKKGDTRDDLLSISVLAADAVAALVHASIVQVLIKKLEDAGLLFEDILVRHISNIYKALQEQKVLEVEDITIDVPSIMNALQVAQPQKPKINLKGRVF